MPFNSQSEFKGFNAYRSKRVVRAAKILKIFSSQCVGIDGGERYPFSVTFDPANKPVPQEGWYVIAYDDGYISFCPPEQFDSGYVQIQD